MRTSVIAAIVFTFSWVPAFHAAENADSAVIHDFEKRVSDYVHLRKNLESRMPPLKTTRSPEEISAHEALLAKAIRESRKGAQPGDIFSPSVAAEMRRLIALAMQPSGKRIEASLQHAEPVQLRLHVNETYPANIPLQSMPPSLLQNLPPLPPELQYRVVGHDLILLDDKATLVVDLISNAVP